jgi:ribosomal protein S18 acetylase RimI-like enzyme
VRTQFRVRPARDADRDWLVPLVRETDAAHAALQPRYFRKADGPVAADLLDELFRCDAQALLIGEDARGRPCGLVQVRLFDTPIRPDLLRSRRGHIERLIVAAKERKRGCGRALVAAAAEWAKRRGATELLLTVWAGNDGASAFYAAAGFRLVSQVLGAPL